MKVHVTSFYFLTMLVRHVDLLISLFITTFLFCNLCIAWKLLVCHFDSRFFECFDNCFLELSVLVLSGRPTSSTVSRLEYCSCSVICFSVAIILVVRLSCGLYFSLGNHNSFSSSVISFISFLRLVRFSLYWASLLCGSWLLLVTQFCSFYRFSFYFLGELLEWLTFLGFVNVYFY